MRLRGVSTAAAVLPLLSGCALPAEPRMACADGVSVHFADNAAQLDLDAVGEVLLTVSTLEACPAAHAIVTGHAEKYERAAVAGARASNVAAVLNKNGIDAQRISIAHANAAGPSAHQPDNRFVSISWK